MKNVGGLLFVCLIITLMVGCAGKSRPSQYAQKGYTSKSGWSQARNTIKAAGSRDIRDTKGFDLAKQKDFNGETGGALGAATFATPELPF